MKRSDRTPGDDRQLVAAGYVPANHPKWMRLEHLLQIKKDLHEQHERSLAQYTAKTDSKVA